MQGKTEADVLLFEMPMQSSLFEGGTEMVQPTKLLSKLGPQSQLQAPFE